MKIPLTYGALSSIAGAVITLLLYFAGFHDSVEKLPTAQWVGGIAGLVIFITALALSMREKRAKAPADVEWGYGSAFGVGVLTVIAACVLSSVFYFIYATFINPGFTDVLFQAQQAKMEAMGLSATQVEQRSQGMRFMMAPGISAVFQAIFGIIIGTICALIVAIFFRERRVDTAAAAGMPPAVS